MPCFCLLGRADFLLTRRGSGTSCRALTWLWVTVPSARRMVAMAGCVGRVV